MSNLPSLPEPNLHDGVYVNSKGRYIGTFDGYTSEKMQDYATAAAEPLLQRIAHLEATASANYGRGHADAHSMLSERIAELERQLEEARKDAEPCPTCESLARAVMLDQTGKA